MLQVNTTSSFIDRQDDIKLREMFVQNLNGTNMTEVILLTSQLPLVVFINLFLEMNVLGNVITQAKISSFSDHAKKMLIFWLEFVTIVFPIILTFTILSDLLILSCLFVIFISFLIIISSVTSPDTFVQYWKLSYSKKDFLAQSQFFGKQPFITYFRSLVFIATTTSILGVDFHIYPRRFAKTETYGVSIMDLGVGLFVISRALVKKPHFRTQSHGLFKTFLETCAFVTLGLIRYLAVQRFNYQQHVSEYGIHWNFFFTLALVNLLSYFVMKISKGYNFICGVTILILHQYLLSTSLESYVLTNIERDTWFSANREGIVSTCGYLSLYLIGVAISNIVNPDKPTTEYKLKMFLQLLSIGVFLSFITYYLSTNFCQVSRRLANLPYVTWVIALSMILLALTLMVELLCISFLPVKPSSKTNLYLIVTPALLESVNFNGLFFFLLSNLLTGAVNICIDVLALDSYMSLLTLTSYMAVNCAIAFGLYLVNIKIKPW